MWKLKFGWKCIGYVGEYIGRFGLGLFNDLCYMVIIMVRE